MSENSSALDFEVVVLLPVVPLLLQGLCLCHHPVFIPSLRVREYNSFYRAQLVPPPVFVPCLGIRNYSSCSRAQLVPPPSLYPLSRNKKLQLLLQGLNLCNHPVFVPRLGIRYYHSCSSGSGCAQPVFFPRLGIRDYSSCSRAQLVPPSSLYPPSRSKKLQLHTAPGLRLCSTSLFPPSRSKRLQLLLQDSTYATTQSLSPSRSTGDYNSCSRAQLVLNQSLSPV